MNPIPALIFAASLIIGVADRPVQNAVAEVTRPALRGPQIQIDGPPPPPAVLFGLPAAVGLSGCAEAEFYARQDGPYGAWPEWAMFVPKAESTCRNDVSSWCCHGYFQIHRQHIGASWNAKCGVHQISDMKGDSVEAKQRNVCMANALRHVQTICDAWDVVHC